MGYSRKCLFLVWKIMENADEPEDGMGYPIFGKWITPTGKNALRFPFHRE
jgi:hypothetical protein